MTTPFVRPEAVATMIVATPVIDVPAHDVYALSEGFEGTVVIGTGGWWPWEDGTLSVSNAQAHSGQKSLRLIDSPSAFGLDFNVDDPNMAGHVAVISFWLNAPIGVNVGTTLSMDYDEEDPANSPYLHNGTGTWSKLSWTGTAWPGTEHWLSLDVTVTTDYAGLDPAELFIDDVEVSYHVPATYTLTPDLTITQGKIALDENYSPYVTGRVTVPMTSEEVLEQIDPRENQRVTVTATEAVSGITRTYDLQLRSRSADHKAQTIDLELASDELMLHDRVNVSTSVDSSARQHESSLRAVCNWALGKIGASLAPGTADANVTARWSAENAILNPNAPNITGYLAAGNCNISLSTTANAGVEGATGFVIGTSVSAGQAFVTAPQSVSARKGQMWTFSNHMFRSTGLPAINGLLRVYELDAAGVVLRQIESTPKVLPQGGMTVPYIWDRHSITVTVQNPNTTKLAVYGTFVATAGGQAIGMDGWMLTEGPVLLPFFSGSTAPAGYVTNWTGATTPVANNSVSERRPADGVERLPELFDWKPGQSLFDFLQPLINASGLRLFCDENRVWRLVDPTEYEVPGYVVAQAKHNTTEGEDLITRNEDTWADAVVVIYSWTGEGGESKTAYDVAGDPTGKAVVRELDREYPGPGAAQHILNSLQGRGRTQTVTVLGQYGAAPGMDATISLPGTYTQTGKVRRVTFDLSSGLMDVETRGLTDALPGSWAEWDPSETWTEVTPTLKWKDA